MYNNETLYPNRDAKNPHRMTMFAVCIVNFLPQYRICTPATKLPKNDPTMYKLAEDRKDNFMFLQWPSKILFIYKKVSE